MEIPAARIALFVANFLGRPLAIERHNLQIPRDRNGRRKEANLAVAGLILELSLDCNRLSVRGERPAVRRHRIHFQLLPDAERSLKDRHAFLDRGQIENLCARVRRLPELEIGERVDYEPDRLVALCSGGIDVHIRRGVSLRR